VRGRLVHYHLSACADKRSVTKYRNGDGVVQAPVPAHLIESGVMTEALLVSDDGGLVWHVRREIPIEAIHAISKHLETSTS